MIILSLLPSSLLYFTFHLLLLPLYYPIPLLLHLSLSSLFFFSSFLFSTSLLYIFPLILFPFCYFASIFSSHFNPDPCFLIHSSLLFASTIHHLLSTIYYPSFFSTILLIHLLFNSLSQLVLSLTLFYIFHHAIILYLQIAAISLPLHLSYIIFTSLLLLLLIYFFFSTRPYLYSIGPWKSLPSLLYIFHGAFQSISLSLHCLHLLSVSYLTWLPLPADSARLPTVSITACILSSLHFFSFFYSSCLATLTACLLRYTPMKSSPLDPLTYISLSLSPQLLSASSVTIQILALINSPQPYTTGHTTNPLGSVKIQALWLSLAA